MANFISLAAAFADWRENIAQNIPSDDVPRLSESWNDYTDSLGKTGQLSALQYHYAPAYDDPMPGDGSRFYPLRDDRDYILDRMGVTIRSASAAAPSDDAAWSATAARWNATASHWSVTIARAGKRFATEYHMGSAYKGEPPIADVVNSLLCDAAGVDQALFVDWSFEYGFDPDSRKALASFRACKATARKLARLFSESELADLRELFEDF